MSSRGTENQGTTLTTVQRLAIYCLCGPCLEVCFTAAWELIENTNPRLHGLTSVWAFAIYGVSGLVIERLYLMLSSHGVPFLGRGLLYLMWSYAWEFSTGLLLRQFDACPWDYEPYFYGHFMGLITAEYAPLWFVTGLVAEKILIKPVLALRIECDKLKTP